MMLVLPNGEQKILSNDITLEEKLILCEELIAEFDDDIIDSIDSQSTTYFLNGLSNYLCWHKENLGDRDRNNGILSNEIEKRMEKKRYHGKSRKDTIFSDLNMSDEIKIFGEVDMNA